MQGTYSRPPTPTWIRLPRGANSAGTERAKRAQCPPLLVGLGGACRPSPSRYGPSAVVPRQGLIQRNTGRNHLGGLFFGHLGNGVASPRGRRLVPAPLAVRGAPLKPCAAIALDVGEVHQPSRRRARTRDRNHRQSVLNASISPSPASRLRRTGCAGSTARPRFAARPPPRRPWLATPPASPWLTWRPPEMP